MPANEGAGAMLRSGFLWNTGLNMFTELAPFATMLVLVRRLEPSAYGEFGLVTSIIGFFTVISFRSFLEHTFQVPVGEEPDYQNIFTIGGLIQGAIFVLVNLMALAMYAFPGYAAAAPLLQVMSVIFFFDWFHELRMSMLERNLDWYRLRGVLSQNSIASTPATAALPVIRETSPASPTGLIPMRTASLDAARHGQPSGRTQSSLQTQKEASVSASLFLISCFAGATSVTRLPWSGSASHLLSTQSGPPYQQSRQRESAD
jgi:hypothetical protein